MYVRAPLCAGKFERNSGQTALFHDSCATESWYTWSLKIKLRGTSRWLDLFRSARPQTKGLLTHNTVTKSILFLLFNINDQSSWQPIFVQSFLVNINRNGICHHWWQKICQPMGPWNLLSCLSWIRMLVPPLNWRPSAPLSLALVVTKFSQEALNLFKMLVKLAMLALELWY